MNRFIQLCRDRLNVGNDDPILEKLRITRSILQTLQKDASHKFTNGELTAVEYVNAVNLLSEVIHREISSEIGADNFEKVFGCSVEEIPNMLSIEMFSEGYVVDDRLEEIEVEKIVPPGFARQKKGQTMHISIETSSSVIGDGGSNGIIQGGHHANQSSNDISQLSIDQDTVELLRKYGIDTLEIITLWSMRELAHYSERLDKPIQLLTEWKKEALSILSGTREREGK